MLNKKLLSLILFVSATQTATAQNLQEIYHLAIENEPEYKAAYINQFSAAESRSQSIAKMLPNISAVAKSSRNRLDNKKVTFQGAGIQHYWSQTVDLQLIQPVFHWEHWVQLDQSDNQIAQAEAQFQAQNQALILKVVEAYFNILSAQDTLTFAEAEKKAIAKQLEQAQQRFEVGLIPITDVNEAQAAFDESRANVIDAANQLDNEKENLRELIGYYEQELDLLAEEVPLALPEPADINAWAKTAESNNFNIIAQLNQTEFARKNIALQRSGHLPTLDIVASYGGSDVNSKFGLRGDSESVGLQLNIPVFEGGAVYSRTKQAEFDFKKARQNLIKVKRTVIRDVKNAFRGVTSSISRVKALKAAVKSAVSALEATEAGFEVGTRTMVDVLTEQRNLYRVKRDYARSRYDYLVNMIRLKNAAGSLSEADINAINQFLIAKTPVSK